MELVQFHPHPCLCQGHQPPPDTAVGRPTLYPEANPDQGQCLGHPSLLLMSLGDAKGKQEGLHWKRSTLEKQPVWQRRVWWVSTLERLRGEASKKGDNYWYSGVNLMWFPIIWLFQHSCSSVMEEILVLMQLHWWEKPNIPCMEYVVYFCFKIYFAFLHVSNNWKLQNHRGRQSHDWKKWFRLRN